MVRRTHTPAELQTPPRTPRRCSWGACAGILAAQARRGSGTGRHAALRPLLLASLTRQPLSRDTSVKLPRDPQKVSLTRWTLRGPGTGLAEEAAALAELAEATPAALFGEGSH